MLAHFGRLAFLTLLNQQVPVDRLGANHAVRSGVHGSLAMRGSEEAGPATSARAVTLRRGAAPLASSSSEAFSGILGEVIAPTPETDLALLLLGRWEATVIGAGSYHVSCEERPGDRRRRLVTFHDGGSFEQSIEPTTGKWLAARQFMVVQFQSVRGDWRAGDGRPGASKQFVEVISRDWLMLRPAGGLAATEQYRRCVSN